MGGQGDKKLAHTEDNLKEKGDREPNNPRIPDNRRHGFERIPGCLARKHQQQGQNEHAVQPPQPPQAGPRLHIRGNVEVPLEEIHIRGLFHARLHLYIQNGFQVSLVLLQLV